MESRFPISRRRFIKTSLLFVPTIFSAGLHGSVHLGCLEPEVINWMGRVVVNAGHYTSLSVIANDTAMKTARPVRAKINRWNNFCGGDFTAAQVPLIKDYGTDTDVALLNGGNPGSSSDWTYVETGTTGGLKPLTAGAFLSTGLGMIAPYSADSYTKVSIGAYVKTVANEASIVMGAQDTPSTNSALFLIVGYVDGNSYGYPFGAAQSVNLIPDTPRQGFYLLSRTSSTLATLYRNGVSVASNSGATIVVPGSDLSLDVFAYHTLISGNAQPTTKQLLGHFEGKDLTAAEGVILYNAIYRANTILSRQV